MKHKDQTQGSDHYDKVRNAQLVYACKRGHVPLALSADAERPPRRRRRQVCGGHRKQHAEAAGVVHAPPAEWSLVAGQLQEYTFTSEAAEAGEDGKRPFKCVLEWVDGAFAPDCHLRFPTVVGMPHGLAFTLPADASIVGKAVAITVRVDAAAVVRKQRINVTSLQIKAEAAEEEEQQQRREPIASRVLPPRSEADVLAELHEIGFSLCKAARNGDCWPLSVLASACKITTEEAAAPTRQTDGKVKAVRERGIDLVTASRIGGVDGNEVRRQELGLKVTPSASAKKLAPWKALRKWRAAPGDETLASAFQFGVAACVRPTAVLERGTTAGTLLDPVKVYAMMEDGKLHRSRALVKKPSTVHFWFHLPFAELKQRLVADPASFAVVLFDRSEWHFSPLVRPENLAPTEVVDGQADVANQDDADEALAAVEEERQEEAAAEEAVEEEAMEEEAVEAVAVDAAAEQAVEAVEAAAEQEVEAAAEEAVEAVPVEAVPVETVVVQAVPVEAAAEELVLPTVAVVPTNRRASQSQATRRRLACCGCNRRKGRGGRGGEAEAGVQATRSARPRAGGDSAAGALRPLVPLRGSCTAARLAGGGVRAGQPHRQRAARRAHRLPLGRLRLVRRPPRPRVDGVHDGQLQRRVRQRVEGGPLPHPGGVLAVRPARQLGAPPPHAVRLAHRRVRRRRQVQEGRRRRPRLAPHLFRRPPPPHARGAGGRAFRQGGAQGGRDAASRRAGARHHRPRRGRAPACQGLRRALHVVVSAAES